MGTSAGWGRAFWLDCLWGAAVVLVGAAAWARYRSPGPSELARQAAAGLADALATLEDPALPPEDRTRLYEDRLKSTEALLRRGIHANVLDSEAVQRLAVVDWELGVLGGNPDPERALDLIRLSSARAPRVPSNLLALGELLLRMGKPDEARQFMAKSVALSPELGVQAITAMRSAGLPLEEIVRALPQSPELFLALEDPYVEAGRESDYAELLRPFLSRHGASLIPGFGRSCLRIGDAERLVDTLSTLTPFPGPNDECERERYLAVGYNVVGRVSEAVDAATRATTLSPNDRTLWELKGMIELESTAPSAAEPSFRRALALSVGPEVDSHARAQLYGELGRALEASERPDEAVDAYRMALSLDGEQPIARSRLGQLGSPITAR